MREQDSYTAPVVSNERLHATLLEIKADVKELKNSKLDIAIHAADQKLFDYKLGSIEKSLTQITFYARWGTLIVAGSIMTAVLNLVIGSQ